MNDSKPAGYSGTWDPNVYLQFAAYRARPLDDLLPRLKIDVPGDIYDLGCGPGNITMLLKERWPERRIIALDSSTDMLRKAEKSYPNSGIAWRAGDIATWNAESPAAMVFANAALHWLPDHRTLFLKLMREVAPGGTFAVQMPATAQSRYHACLHDVKASAKWRTRLAGVEPHEDPHPVGVYYDLLAPLSATLEVWETNYWHVLRGAHAVTAWMMGTALVPIISVLDASEKSAFIDDINAATDAAYPRQVDGSVLFDMRRVFIVATRAR